MTTDHDLLSAFESCSLPSEQWNHRAHVRVAYLYASQHDLETATDGMRSGIKAYNQATGTPDALDRGYHETMTQAFMRLVFTAHLRSGEHASSDEFCDSHPELLTKTVLREFYSRERLMTMEAKVTFVEPDLCPLPIVVGESTTIANVQNNEELAVVRQLFTEFAESLDFDLSFQDFETELAELPGSYAIPKGRLLLARTGNTPVGCIALRPHKADKCEMKRLWVRPSARGAGLGRHLAVAIINEARQAGYSTVLLDTVPSMAAAIPLYRSLGFTKTAPYTTNPVPGAMFMELDLARNCVRHADEE